MNRSRRGAVRPLYYDVIDSPVGKILVAVSRRGLFRLHYPLRNSAEKFLGSYSGPPFSFRPIRSTAKTARVKRQLGRYFRGRLRRFSLPLDIRGTTFQIAVWKELSRVPFGRTVSYGELAGRIGSPKASRAVGMANNRNRIGIVIPCHRVLGSNGGLTGYAAGLDVKKRLLDHESDVLAALGSRRPTRHRRASSVASGPAACAEPG